MMIMLNLGMERRLINMPARVKALQRQNVHHDEPGTTMAEIFVFRKQTLARSRFNFVLFFSI